MLLLLIAESLSFDPATNLCFPPAYSRLSLNEDRCPPGAEPAIFGLMCLSPCKEGYWTFGPLCRGKCSPYKLEYECSRLMGCSVDVYTCQTGTFNRIMMCSYLMKNDSSIHEDGSLRMTQTSNNNVSTANSLLCA